MLDWERLRVLAAVAEHGSITAAADALHVTHPAVSQHLRKLERQAQARLVEPEGRGIRLTTAGQVLASSAATVASTISAAERDLANLSGEVVGALRIGSVASALRALLPEVLTTMTTRHPRVRPSVTDGEVIDLLPELRARRLDAVVLESWSPSPARMPPGVELTWVLTEDVRLAVSERHPLAERDAVRFDELGEQRWASCPAGTEPYESLVQTLRSHGFDAEVPYRVADYGTQLSLVAADLAVSMVPRIGREPCPAGIRFVPCEPALSRAIGVATPAGSGTTPAARVLVTELEHAAASRGVE